MEEKPVVYDKRNGGKAWLIAIVCIFCGALFACTLQKIPPTMGVLIPFFQVGATEGGFLITIVSFMGVVMAVPSGALVFRFGPKKVGIFALAITLIGTVMGTMCSSYPLMCVSRVIEGVGFGCCNVICPTIIEAWFEGKKRGMPMALWSCWMSFGILMAFNFANFTVDFANPASWTRLWWFIAALLLIALVLFILIARMPKIEPEKLEEMAQEQERAKFSDGLKSPATWLLGCSFMMFGVGMGAVSGFGSQYCVMALGIDMATANSYTSLLAVGCIVGGFVSGFVLDKLAKYRLQALVVSMVLTAICFYFIFTFKASWAVAFYLIGGFVLQLVPACAFALAPDTAPNAKTISVVMSVVIILENLGPTFAPTVVGAIVDATGAFTMATVLLCIVGVIGIILTLVYMKVQRGVYKKKGLPPTGIPEA